jgi:membrane-associated phospholipid phosphatase
MRLEILVAAGCLSLISNTLPGQQDSLALANKARIPSRAWIVPAAIGVSIAVDEEAREGALASHSRTLDHFARVINPLGTGRCLIPAMAISFVGATAIGNRALERGTLNTVAGYVASDITESALKPLLGRERPHVTGNSRRFHAFTRSGDWHSFPSAHVAHITSIVEAISEQSHSGALSGVGDLLVSLVGWDRVYEDQHWISDVTATVAITSLVSRATVRWMETRWQRAETPESGR